MPRQVEKILLEEDPDDDTGTVTRFDPFLGPQPIEVNRAPLDPYRRESSHPLGALGTSLIQHAPAPASEAPPHEHQLLLKQPNRNVSRIPGLDYSQLKQCGSHDPGTCVMASPLLDQNSQDHNQRTSRSTRTEGLQVSKEGHEIHSDFSELRERAETGHSLLTRADRQKLREHLDTCEVLSEASKTAAVERGLHDKEPTQSISQRDPGKSAEIREVNQLSVQPQGSQHVGVNTMSPSQAGQHLRVRRRGKRGGTHAQRLHAWKAGPKTLSDSKLRELRNKTETDRSSLTRSERQKLRKHLELEASDKSDINTGRELFQKGPMKDQRGQQQNKRSEPPDLNRDRLWGLSGAPAPSSQPYRAFPSFHHPPPHSETTPPPAPTFMPSSVPSAVQHAYHRQRPLPAQITPPPASTAYTSSKNAAPRCSGCNVNLAEIERTTRFRYPDTCPLCRTPRVYLPGPRTPPTAPTAMLQQIGDGQIHAVAQAAPIMGDYVSTAIVSEDRSLGAVSSIEDAQNTYLVDQMNEVKRNKRRYLQEPVELSLNAKRAKLCEERNDDEESQAEGGEHGRCEDRVPKDEEYDEKYEHKIPNNEDENYDDEATVDKEEWEQARVKRDWEGMYDEDEDISIKSEDKV